ncbi:Endopolyphosphatase [Teratosphaeria nubilosa]|uniref:Endopolyphosphatase n=1 Tax=Teratosphaeria nubilosa TaxID=161662 RepID=A0A6G1L536_9PEZI|nr:Endopolyphosphatase [Teratosphaeria nubilosa]
MHRLWSICLAAVAGRAFAVPVDQVPLGQLEDIVVPVKGQPDVLKKRPLHGRFLHITDMHPDRFYEVYSATDEDSACHRGQGPAGVYGAEVSDCDSPYALINKTMEWVEANLKDKIDFVVWTGDSARHDNDEEIPRNAEQVVGSNEWLVEKMFDVFGKHNGDEEDDDPNNDFVIPIVPNLGNNDILPHNVMAKGPNAWTRTYSRVWRRFVPEVQRHQFEQGGWFYVEVIPNKLAVFSLNTLYWFNKNAAVDGCASPKEPGYQQMEWLRIQLQFMRDRGVKAILAGHVPPIREDAKTLWEETCWQKYTLWQRQYRDVIISSLYGHFNYDHFVLQDFKDLHKDTKKGRMNYLHASESDGDDGDDLHTAVSDDYWTELRGDWAELPEPPKSYHWLNDSEWETGKAKKARQAKTKFLKKIGGKYAERYSASFVSASIVPNLLPVLRVYEYNISGLAGREELDAPVPPPLYVPDSSYAQNDVEANKKKKKKDKKYKFTIPDSPARSAPPGPAYSQQPLSLLKYTQYYANLTYINNDFVAPSDSGEDTDIAKWNPGKHKGRKPHDRAHTPQPKKFKFQMHYDTQEDDIYKLKDLTMPSLVDLARRIGDYVPDDDNLVLDDAGEEPSGSDTVDANKKKNKKKRKKGDKDKKKKKKHHHKNNEAWFTFIRRAFVETKPPGEIEDQFGD